MIITWSAKSSVLKELFGLPQKVSQKITGKSCECLFSFQLAMVPRTPKKSHHIIIPNPSLWDVSPPSCFGDFSPFPLTHLFQMPKTPGPPHTCAHGQHEALAQLFTVAPTQSSWGDKGKCDPHIRGTFRWWGSSPISGSHVFSNHFLVEKIQQKDSCHYELTGGYIQSKKVGKSSKFPSLF